MSTCTTCQEMPSCIEGLDRYSLQDDNYLFVLTCPPGFDCNAIVGTVTVICCDGTELSATIPAGANSVVRAAILQGMLNEAGRRLAFCDPPVIPDPPGDPTIDPNDPGTPGTPPVLLYYNRPQSWTVYCPDGTPFTYTVPAGRYLGFDQATVDALAVNEARRLAALHQICLSPLSVICCADTVFSETITVFGGGTTDAHAWSVVSGALPTGLTMPSGWVAGNHVTLSGTPTAGGTYTFTVRVTATDGHSITRTYTIVVVGIVSAPDPLPDGEEETVYPGATFSVSAGSTAVFWSATNLPPGLTLNAATGVISGMPDPDSAAAYNMTVTVTATTADGTPVICSRNFTLTVNPAAECVDWTTLLWGYSFGGAFLSTLGNGTATFTPDNTASDSFDTEATAPFPPNPDSGSALNDASITYSGGECHCNLHIVCTKSGNPLDLCGGPEIWVGPNLVLSEDFHAAASGTYDLPFTIPDTFGVPTLITVRVFTQTCINPGNPGAGIHLVGQITNV